MTRTLSTLLARRLVELNSGDDACAKISALTMIAGAPETNLLTATEATRECGRILKEECAGLVLSSADGSRLAQDVAHLPRAKAAFIARSVASSTVAYAARQARGDRYV